MISFLIHRDWKAWVSIIGLTILLLLFGVGNFQHQFSFWLFFPLFLVMNWFFYSAFNWINIRLKWNQKPLLSSAKHLFFALISACFILLVGKIDSHYYTAFFSGFVLVGVVFSSFDYLLAAMEDLAVIQTSKVIQESNTSDETEAIFELKNTKGKVTFHQPVKNILFFEANDNYMTIYYEENESVNKSMERMPIRKAEESIHDLSADFIRVHKSYLVNKKLVVALVGRAQNYRIKMKGCELEIPISRRLDVNSIFPNL